jgi:DNA-directed RNA polymerase beta subunit
VESSKFSCHGRILTIPYNVEKIRVKCQKSKKNKIVTEINRVINTIVEKSQFLELMFAVISFIVCENEEDALMLSSMRRIDESTVVWSRPS